MVRSEPSKLVSRSPFNSISPITRGRANSATRRPAAANMPPTKQPMLPAPATPIGRVEFIPLLHRFCSRIDSRLSHSPPIGEAVGHLPRPALRGERVGVRGLSPLNELYKISSVPRPSPEIRVALEFRPLPVKNGER